MFVYQKARIFNPDSPTSGFYVQFNPNTLEYSTGMCRHTQKGVKDQDSQGQQGEPHTQSPPVANEWGSTLSVRLFFHNYVNDLVYSDVRPNINRIQAFLPKTPPAANSGSMSDQGGKSPRITFAWGTMIYTGTLESFRVTYQMFAFDGTPVQAEVSLTIRGEDEEITSNSINEALSETSDTDFSLEDDTLFLSSLSWLFQ